jgi:hypothetical protein
MPIKNRLKYCNESTDFENLTYLKIFSISKSSENDTTNISVLQIRVLKLKKNKRNLIIKVIRFFILIIF